MSLEGAKLICLNANDNDQFETIPAHGKSFKFGYYMNCDVVLEHPDAIGVQCVIECDAFGRVTIENRFTDQPITLDGKTLGKMRPLLHNTEICILGKKYMWQFEGNPHLKSFQMEDINDFVTPVKKNIKPQQAPNSEPTRKWRRQFQNRLTIHSFAYCIKAGESPQDVNITTDENKPLNIHERITDADTDIVQNKILSTSQATVPDFIDLNSPKMGQGSFGLRRTTLSCCNLSETVITSYSPRETGIRQEKSFAVVQSPLAAVKMKTTDVSFGPFNHTDSPQTILNPRPSMHLIDLTTPMKLIPAVSSPMKTLLKSTLKSNLLKGTSPRTPQKTRKVMDLSSTASVETVYSVRSTDDESVIIVSDDASSPTSPIAKTPPRARTPQSLMKRAILSSAKKAAVTKKLLNLAAPKQMQVLITPKNPATIRFQSQSTPQRKSFGRLPSSAESLSAGKSRKSMITSTPFRRGEDIIPSSSKLLSTANSQSPSVGIARKESRNSLMLRQALSMTSAQNLTKKRKSVSSLHVEHKPKKSVSFFEKIKKGEQTHIGGVEVVSKLNDTLSIEEKEEVLSTCKDASVLPDKEQNQNLDTFQTKPLKQTQGMPKQEVSKVLLQHKTNSFSENQCLQVLPETDLQYDSLIESIDKAPFKVCTDHENSSLVENTSTDSKQIDPEVHKQFEVKQTTQSSGHGLEINENDNKTLNTCDDNEYDIEGMDEIFKTPKAKNLMILSSPKSISLQKSSPDSVELVHSTEFDLSANLDELFQTPQSELLNSHVDAEAPTALPASFEALSPEEAFDLLIGRPAYKKSYARKTPQTKHELSLLKMSNDPNFPKTDIEEWIDSVNDSIELMEGAQDEDEMTFLTTAMGEFSRDPLIMNSVIENSNAKKCPIFSKTPKDELEMSIQEGDGEKNKSIITIRKDPLELTVPRPLSPNISGIDLLDHTSESIFSETLAVSDDSSIKEVEKAMTVPDANDQNDVIIGILKQPCKAHEDKARSEIEEAFKKFENERRILEGKRLVSTPEAKKTSISKFALRRSMGDCSLKDENIDFKAFDSTHSEKSNLESIGFKLNEQVQAVLPINKIEANFENCSNLLQESLVSIKDKFVSETPGNQRDINEGFENIEQVSEFLLNETNSKHKPKIMLLAKHTIKCPDSDLSVDDQSIEQTFNHFGEEPAFSIKRVLKSPEPEKITRKEYGKTIGTSLVPEVKIDWQAAKAERDLKLAFTNFEEHPDFSVMRVVKTPQLTEAKTKDHRRTLGTALMSERRLDLNAAKAERELELAFKNFEEQPEYSVKRIVKTPEHNKSRTKDHRRTLGTAMVSEVKFDLKAAKAERELEMAIEHFEKEPEFSGKRAVKTPELPKVTTKDHRRTLGTALIPEGKLDLKATKAERELELAFKNFEEEPEFSVKRVVKTPDPNRVRTKDHRRTLGTAMMCEVKFDLKAARAERELELAFENFKETPHVSGKREVKTPEPTKVTMKDRRRTLGTAFIPEEKVDLKAAKAERELELAFQNFEGQPDFSVKRVIKTPEPNKSKMKDHRRTLGTAMVSEVKFDLKAAKAERELELAFENFKEKPHVSGKREVKTPEPTKVTMKDHRRTLGTAFIPEVKIDLKAAKAERELKLAFEHFEEEPEISGKREVKTPEPTKATMRDHRRTLGTALISEGKLDLKAAKAERELELAFKNFEEQPDFSVKRVVKTPEPNKSKMKDHRRTLGTAMVSEVKFDLKAAKAERELELAFENFKEKPHVSGKREVKTPEPTKVKIKDHRRTLGTALIPEGKLDLKAAKAEHELELAFKNFKEQPEFSVKRTVKTPEHNKARTKDHRRTLGTALVTEVKLDLNAAKAARELEIAFENFEEKPDFSVRRVVKTPEPTKVTTKDHRRNLCTALISELKHDSKAVKAERELQLASETPKLDKSQVKEITRAEDEDCKSEVLKTLDRENDSDNEIFVKSENNKTNEIVLDHQIDPQNNLLQQRMCQNSKSVTPKSKILRSTPSRRTRQNSVDTFIYDAKNPGVLSRKALMNSFIEDESINKFALCLESTDVNSTESKPNQMPTRPRGKRIRKKTSEASEISLEIIDAHCVLELNLETKFPNKHAEEKSVINLRTKPDKPASLAPNQSQKLKQMRKTRQNSIDTFKADNKIEINAFVLDSAEENIAQTNEVETKSSLSALASDQIITVTPVALKTLKQMRRTRQNSVDMATDVDIESSDLSTSVQVSFKGLKKDEVKNKSYSRNVDSTDDAARQKKFLRNTRISKKAIQFVDTPLKETGVDGSLECVVEEERNIDVKSGNKEKEITSIISCKGETEEIIAKSPFVPQSHIRGRRAHLTVVLSESKNANHQTLKELSEDNGLNDEQSERNDMENDISESIPPTPVSTNSRGRRPQNKIQTSTPKVPALEKTRISSIDEHAEIKQSQIDKIAKQGKQNDADKEDDLKKDESFVLSKTLERKLGTQNGAPTNASYLDNFPKSEFEHTFLETVAPFVEEIRTYHKLNCDSEESSPALLQKSRNCIDAGEVPNASEHATSGRRGRRIKPVKTVDLTTENMDALLDRDTMTKKRGRRAGVNKESVLESIVEANSRIRNSENVVEVLLPGEEEQKKDINDLKTTASELNITALLHSTYEEKDVEKLSQTKEFNEPKRSHKRAAQKGDVVEKEVISKKRTRNPLLRQEVESLNESETREENVSLLLKGDNTPARKRIRKAPKKLAEFVVSNLVQPVKIETCEYKCESSVILDSPSVSKKRGRPAKTTSEKVESNQECMTPVSKRGRRGMIVHLNNEDSTPSDYQKTRKISQIIATSKLESSEYKCENSVIFDSPSVSKKRGRPAKMTLKKDESMTPDSKHTRKGIFENEESTSSRKEDHQKALELSEAACTRDDKHVSISVRNTIINSATEPKEELKNTPGKEAFNKVVTLSTEKPSVSVSEEKPIASDVTTRNKPTRSREKGVLKNDSKEDISKHTEDAQPVEATKPKLIHNRKAVIEENISIKEKIIQEPAQNSNRDLENSSNNDTEEKQAATTVKPKSNKSQTSVKKVNISTESRLIQEPEQSSNLELEICSKKQSIITEESQSEVSHKPRSTRNRKAAIKESIQTEEKPIKKTAQNANIDLQTNKESVVPEGTQVAATTKLKSNRTQKVVDKANISTEARLIKEPKQSSNPEFEICSKKESVVTEESQSVVATKPRSTRNRKAVIKEKIPIEEKPIKETAKHLKLKLETISNIDTFATEETQVATTTKPKSNRTQKVVDKANISTQARLIQEPEQNSNLELEICSKKESVVTEESQSVVAIKPRSTRNRTAVIREKIPIEEKPIKETAKHLKLKLETISNIETVATEETQVATTNKPKSNRTQTIVDKANISTEARLIQEPEQSSNPELKICFKKESVVTEESHTAVATKPRSTRNRKAVIKEKIPIEEEPIKETEETHVATTTKPKSNRTQKGVKKANTSTEAKFIQESALNSNTELEVSSNKEEEAQPVVATKPRSNRYRKAVTHENISIEDKPIIETTQISNTELDTSSSKESVDTEKTQVAATTIRKTNRAQKVVKKANISTDAKVIQEKARNSNNEVNTSSNNELVVSEEAQPVVAPKPRSNRVQKAVIKENISMDEKLDKKTAQLLNTELEEEARPVATTKLNLNRGRKATTSTEIKNTQEPAQHSNIELEISSDKASVNIKPKRGKRLATADMDNNKALVTIEHSIPIKKLVRSRTPAPSAAKESNDNMLQLESSPQPPLQSGKVSDVNTKIVPKRHILEIQANDERNDDTPSKRTRRKPRKFL